MASLENILSEGLRTAIMLGASYNVYKDATGVLLLNGITSEIDTMQWYAFWQLGFTYDLSSNATFSFTYLSTLSNKGSWSLSKTCMALVSPWGIPPLHTI